MFPEFEWRGLHAGDIRAVCALMGAGIAVDGGLPFAASEAFVSPSYMPPAAAVTLGGFDADGHLVACAALKKTSADARTIVGMVHPGLRGRGLGRFLLEWSVKEAADVSDVYLRTESLTDAAAHLYARFGFILESASNVMRRDLTLPLPRRAFPEGITLASWSDRVAEDFYQVYQSAFRERPGFSNPSAKEWIAGTSEDDDFSPERSFVAYADGTPVGFIAIDNNWIAQVGVVPAWRKRGLGSALLVDFLQHAADSGDREASLDVNANNSSAISVYTKLGFEVIGRRALYLRVRDGM